MFGAAMPSLHVKQGVKNGVFMIAGGVPNGQVCWEIKGERNDPAMQASPLVVEEQKAIPGRLFNGQSFRGRAGGPPDGSEHEKTSGFSDR